MKALKLILENQSEKLKNLSIRVFNRKSLVQSEQTPYEIIDEYQNTKIRYYASPNKKYKEPLVFIPPLAVSTAIYDLHPHRSLVQYFQNQGFDLYLLEWDRFNYSHHSLNFLYFIDDLIPNCIERIQKHAQVEDLSIHGWSMGGVFVTLYTALHRPQYVKNLIVLGSPMNAHKSGKIGKLFDITHQFLNKKSKLQSLFLKENIATQYIHTPGIINSIGFKLINPKSWLDSKIQLLKNLGDAQFLTENATMSQFLNHMIDYPGGVNKDMILNLWLKNPLKDGHIQLVDKLIELKNIDCSVFIGAGDNDQIVSEAAAKPLIELTNSKDVTFTLIPGGHLGLMSSQKSAEQFWPKLSNWLALRSTQI
ncbi:poly(R)-hydroxyalkanoic acid synthase [Acinetobacter sp. Ac_877]|uniref:alpha/beta fold hydrolase n=1 Tax=Acinetobacter portensis TaxID=1839785 RepID=UPI00128C4CC1|nr:alpha/beta fold hydrolase [Acinetobacter portensis]MPW40734.1 poly(R)-hydroxyalkanoic acid synthase [Acinetobacter portensis]